MLAATEIVHLKIQISTLYQLRFLFFSILIFISTHLQYMITLLAGLWYISQFVFLPLPPHFSLRVLVPLPCTGRSGTHRLLWGSWELRAVPSPEPANLSTLLYSFRRTNVTAPDPPTTHSEDFYAPRFYYSCFLGFPIWHTPWRQSKAPTGSSDAANSD